MWVQPCSVSDCLGMGGHRPRGRLVSGRRSPACPWAPACRLWPWGCCGHCLSQWSGRLHPHGSTCRGCGDRLSASERLGSLHRDSGRRKRSCLPREDRLSHSGDPLGGTPADAAESPGAMQLPTDPPAGDGMFCQCPCCPQGRPCVLSRLPEGLRAPPPADAGSQQLTSSLRALVAPILSNPAGPLERRSPAHG